MHLGECAWTQSGSWDESFFLYSEETDFALGVPPNWASCCDSSAIPS